MEPMQPIPQPSVLDPDRSLNGAGSAADVLEKALHETASYAQQLWQTLDDARRYLADCLPPDPRSPDGMHASLGAHPTGPDDDAGWNEWMATYSAVTSVLCGPHGDSGYGVKEAEHAAQLRRTAPAVLLRAHHPQLQSPVADPGKRASDSSASQDGGASVDKPSKGSTSRTVGITVLTVLVLRGLLPPRRTRPRVG